MESRIERLRTMRVSVIGAARSGLAAARLLTAAGASVFVSDRAGTGGEEAAALEAAGIAHELGGHTARVAEADLMVLSPGVPSDAPVVREAAAAGIRLVSELEVASWFWEGPVLAVTGTNGKTTTTALLGRMLADAGVPSVVGGNIGTAFSQLAMEADRRSTAVLEVSSFQLDHCETFRPAVALLLNITPDHLDRYGNSFERYAESKAGILTHQQPGDSVVFSGDDLTVRGVVEGRAGTGVRRLAFTLAGSVEHEGAFLRDGVLVHRLGGRDRAVVASAEISIPGVHNLANAMAASLAARLAGVSPARIRATLRNFRGVEHRLEFVRELGGVRYVNDSKATNVDAVRYALGSFAGPIVLLLGGRDKGNDYTAIAGAVRERVRAIIAIGESSGTVRDAFAGIVPVSVATTMEEAVRAAARAATAGDTVLLSPACASFDWFRNYEHRGEAFKAIVASLRGGTRA